MVKDIELDKKIDKMYEEVKSTIAYVRFTRNSSFFIEKRERLYPPYKKFKGAKT